MQRFLLLLGVLGALLVSWYSTSLSASWATEYTAECHIDSDNFFGDNDKHEMNLEGTIDSIMQDCYLLGEMRYQNNFSIALKKLSPRYNVESWMHTGICHIDYDRSVDLNKFVVGTLVGNSLIELFNLCSELGELTYRNATFAVVDLNKSRSLDYSKKADCWVNNTAVYEPGHLLIGKVFGNSLREILYDCRYAASKIYRKPYSAGLENIQ